MGTVLDEIITGVRQDLARRMLTCTMTDLEAAVAAAPAPRDAMRRFRNDQLSVIAEVKRASPSKGALASINDPAQLAAAYEAGGAAAVSVLTERRRFNGSLADLDAVRERVGLPVLRKDFIVTDYQLWEARAHGADLALLIVAALDDAELDRLHRLALDLGLVPLVEVHDEAEAGRAAHAGAELVGVNNRNLKTLEVDVANFERIVSHLPDEVVKVAESGILTGADAARVRSAGADVILVGEALVTHAHPAQAISELVAAADREEFR